MSSANRDPGPGTVDRDAGVVGEHELDAARESTRDVDVANVPARFPGVDLSFLLGLVDRCADAKGGPHPIAAVHHEPVCGAVLETLHSDFPRYHPAAAELAATLHRASWALQNRESPKTHDAADLARVAHGLHRHPHSLFTLRSSGLVYSKDDRYVSAWLTFAELRLRLSHYERSYLEEQVDEDVLAQFREVQQQALLAETGTAARTVERVLVDWMRTVQPLEPRWRRLQYHDSFNTLQRGVLTGTLSWDEVSRMPTAARKTVSAAAIPSWQRRPGVMTARCHLELLALARVVEAFGTRQAPPPHTDWDAFVSFQHTRFLEHYSHAHSSASIEFDDEHIRELVQLRLHVEMLFPQVPVPPVDPRTGVVIPDCLLVETPTRDELAEWLLAGHHNANIAVSITAPEYLAHMQAISGDDGLIDWMMAPRFDPLRRDTVQQDKNGPRILPEGRRAQYDDAWQHASEAFARLRAPDGSVSSPAAAAG